MGERWINREISRRLFSVIIIYLAWSADLESVKGRYWHPSAQGIPKMVAENCMFVYIFIS